MTKIQKTILEMLIGIIFAVLVVFMCGLLVGEDKLNMTFLYIFAIIITIDTIGLVAITKECY